MQVKDLMTQSAEFINPEATLREAAIKMRDLDCGFLPIGTEEKGKLEGVVTDRDIVIRAIAEGSDPARTNVREAETQRVLYCFEGDGLDQVSDMMREQQVHRLIVLDNPENKRLRGVVSLGDLIRHNETQLGARAAEGIVSRAA